MRRSPLGVAMGVSGELHTQLVQPLGQVPSTGWLQVGSGVPSGPGTSQQISPTAQHLFPQQVAVPMQFVPVSHGGLSLHTP